MGDAAPSGRGSRARWLRGAAPYLLALLLVLLAAAARQFLGERVPDISPTALFYPAILITALAGGLWPGVLALILGVLISWTLLTQPYGFAVPDLGSGVNLAVFVFTGALMLITGVRSRTSIDRLQAGNRRLADRELRYRTLFECVSDGFALLRAIRDERGRLTDYVVLEANPALLQIMGAELHEVIGRRGREIVPDAPAAWFQACNAALKGQPITFEYQSADALRWFEMHVSAVGEDQLAQFMVEITERKLAELRQSELFDELNHRVKNNLAIVSAMLSMQARNADIAEVSEHLRKAVDRVHTIADVHAALYRSGGKDEVDFAGYLHDLCNRLSRSLLEGDRVRLEVRSEPAALPLDMAVALGVIVNELVTNAAKHAYPPPASGAIVVELRRSAGGLDLIVADAGVGLSGQLGAGLGMRLIRSLAQQIGATVERGDGPGAVFTVKVPHYALLRNGLADPQARLL